MRSAMALPGAVAIEHHLAARKCRRIDPPQRHVGVGDGRFAAAAAVANRARLRTGAPRADRDASERIDARDRTAAGADLDHLDHRNAQRQTAAFGEAIDPRHFEHPRRLRARLVDKANLRRGAAHVERHHLVETVLPGDGRGEDRAAGGSGFDQPHRKANGGLGRGNAAARCHQQHRTAKAGAGKLAFQPGHVAAHQGLQIGVGAGGGETLVFAHLRRHFGRQRYREMGQPARDRVADAALVIRIGEAVQEADRNGLDVLAGERFDGAGHARIVERHLHRALGVDALADRQPKPARHQRRRQIDIDVVLLEAVFVPDLDDVAKALGGQKRCLGALALDQSVGGKRRAVDDEVHVAGRDVRRGDHRAHDREYALFGRARRRQALRGVTPLADFEGDIGEGAADIDAEPDCGRRSHARNAPATAIVAARTVIKTCRSGCELSRDPAILICGGAWLWSTPACNRHCHKRRPPHGSSRPLRRRCWTPAVTSAPALPPSP